MRLLHKVFFWIWRESSQDEYRSKTCSGGGGGRVASPTRRARNLRTLVPGFTGCKIDLGIASPFRMWETMLGGMGDIKPA